MLVDSVLPLVGKPLMRPDHGSYALMCLRLHVRDSAYADIAMEFFLRSIGIRQCRVLVSYARSVLWELVIRARVT